jgi:hypothetical protein
MISPQDSLESSPGSTAAILCYPGLRVKDEKTMSFFKFYA